MIQVSADFDTVAEAVSFLGQGGTVAPPASKNTISDLLAAGNPVSNTEVGMAADLSPNVTYSFDGAEFTFQTMTMTGPMTLGTLKFKGV